jgi:hypothetical protein
VYKYAVAAALLLLASIATAQPTSGPYVGVGVGSFDYQEKDDIGVLISDTTISSRLIGGYQIHENLAIEAAIGKTGDIKESYPFGPFGSGNSVDLRVDYEFYTVRALWLVPMGRLDLFGGIGYFDAKSKWDVRATGIGILDEGEDDDSGATLFGGVNFYLNRITIRGEYEWFNTDSDLEVWNLGVGVLFHF